MSLWNKEAPGSHPPPPGNPRPLIWVERFSHTTFNKDGAGYRVQKMDFDGPAAFNGTQRTDEIVDILWLKQPTAQPSKRWFRFDHKKTAFQGDRESSITAPLEMR